MTGQIIGMVGAAGSGKDETAKAIISLRDSYIRVGWADILKDMGLAIDPYVMVDENDLEAALAGARKDWCDVPSAYVCPKIPPPGYVVFLLFSELVEAVGMEAAKMFPEVRRYFQRLGKEGGRDCLGCDVWVDAACNSTIIPALNSNQSVVITDCRFTNEIRRVRELGGEIWQVERDPSMNTVALTSTASSHASEKEWRKERADRIIVNNGTLMDLRYVVAIALGQMDRAQGKRETLGLGKKKERELVSS